METLIDHCLVLMAAPANDSAKCHHPIYSTHSSYDSARTHTLSHLSPHHPAGDLLTVGWENALCTQNTHSPVSMMDNVPFRKRFFSAVAPHIISARLHNTHSAIQKITHKTGRFGVQHWLLWTNAIMAKSTLHMHYIYMCMSMCMMYNVHNIIDFPIGMECGCFFAPSVLVLAQ